ncbi:universal stress protein [Janthinobacterium sp. 17J80-10]|uniref:universal stress protein n=1 Tax=Janthinobacterium sp. 17J80-10 TaxID=2497863 RepID=UPI001005402D|nr:universal stress protein [Janthinobacterium sp. 17J80-10]QAU35157.1 universal stress protein [Janthinobacterium sp. 17J80-10]
MFKTILVPTDGSPRSEKAVSAAVRFAKEINGKIIGISIAEPHPSPLLSDSEFFGTTHGVGKNPHDLALEHVQKVAEAAAAEGVPCETVFVHAFKPHEEILKTAAKYHCDLVFMAPIGKSGWTGLFLDSETQKVLTHATIPVLVYH